MPVTTILQHAIQRDVSVTAEADPDTRMSNNEGNVIPDHSLIESNLGSAESRIPKITRAAKGKQTATVISSSPSPQSKPPRKASASKRQRISSSSSTQVASETDCCTVATEEPLSTEPPSVGGSFVPSNIPNDMFNGESHGMATYEQPPEGTWEPQLTCCHAAPTSSTNWAVENPFPGAYTAAEEAFNLYDCHSTTVSPFTNQSNSDQRSSFASSVGQVSPASYFTAHSSPVGYKSSQATPEDSATIVGNNIPPLA